MTDYPTGTTKTSTWLFDPTGTYLYGGSIADNKVFGFKQNADGSVTAISQNIGLGQASRSVRAGSDVRNTAIRIGGIAMNNWPSTMSPVPVPPLK